MTTMVHRGWQQPDKSSKRKSNRWKAAKIVFIEGKNDPEIGEKKGKRELEHIPGPLDGVPTQHQNQRFQFINRTGDCRMNDRELRKLVRSHAAQDHSRMEQRKETKQTNGPLLLDSLTKNLSETAKPGLDKSTRAKAESYSNLENGHHFQAVYGPLWTLKVLRYFVDVSRAMYPRQTAFKINPINPDGFFQQAISDKAMTHSLLYISATYLSLLKEDDGSKEAYFHLTNAVQLVNTRMEDPSQATADLTICVIAILACTEVEFSLPSKKENC